MATLSPSSPTVFQGPSSPRPQADPLPTKRGEFGYRESLIRPLSSNPEPESATTARDSSIPARHPADTELQSAAPQPEASPIASENVDQSAPQPSSTPMFSFLKPKFGKFGVRSSTIFLLVTQGSLLFVTIGFWIILARLVLPSSNAGKAATTGIFVHLSFVIGTIFQIVLLERLIFRYRAERYAALHPGQVIPDMFNRGEQVSTRLALAPWNRPPLPTYAAVLMESGVGTGDVEDNRIAVPPPPAYGHTRGSTLILAGFIDPELREQSRLAREARGERISQATITSIQSIQPSVKSLPRSYVTVDSEWDARCDMSRATYLAETLARLESEEVDLTTVQVVSPALTQTGFVVPGSPTGPCPTPISPGQLPSASPP